MRNKKPEQHHELRGRGDETGSGQEGGHPDRVSLTVFTMPVIPVVEREHVPLMAFGAGHDITVPFKKWVFRVPLTDYRLSPMMLKFASETWSARNSPSCTARMTQA